MGAADSKQLASEGPVVVEFPEDLHLTEAGEASKTPTPAAVAAPTEASATAPSDAVAAAGTGSSGAGAGGDGDPLRDSRDQLPALPAFDRNNSANGVILQNLSDYHLEKQVLGEGAFGKVRLATSSRTGHRVAVKVIKRKKLNDRAEVLLQREVKHHEKVRAPFPRIFFTPSPSPSSLPDVCPARANKVWGSSSRLRLHPAS